jgi:hypothetical protein
MKGVIFDVRRLVWWDGRWVVKPEPLWFAPLGVMSVAKSAARQEVCGPLSIVSESALCWPVQAVQSVPSMMWGEA